MNTIAINSEPIIEQNNGTVDFEELTFEYAVSLFEDEFIMELLQDKINNNVSLRSYEYEFLSNHKRTKRMKNIVLMTEVLVI